MTGASTQFARPTVVNDEIDGLRITIPSVRDARALMLYSMAAGA
jgi:hypothetical protein